MKDYKGPSDFPTGKGEKGRGGRERWREGERDEGERESLTAKLTAGFIGDFQLITGNSPHLGDLQKGESATTSLLP